MAEFFVKNIISSTKIKVDGWRWRDVSGDIVKIRGIEKKSTPEEEKGQKIILEIILKDQPIQLYNAEFINKEKTEILCDVILRGVNVKEYFK